MVKDTRMPHAFSRHYCDTQSSGTRLVGFVAQETIFMIYKDLGSMVFKRPFFLWLAIAGYIVLIGTCIYEMRQRKDS